VPDLSGPTVASGTPGASAPLQIELGRPRTCSAGLVSPSPLVASAPRALAGTARGAFRGRKFSSRLSTAPPTKPPRPRRPRRLVLLYILSRSHVGRPRALGAPDGPQGRGRRAPCAPRRSCAGPPVLPAVPLGVLAPGPHGGCVVLPCPGPPGSPAPPGACAPPHPGPPQAPTHAPPCVLVPGQDR